MISRRHFLQTGATLAGGSLLLSRTTAAPAATNHLHQHTETMPSAQGTEANSPPSVDDSPREPDALPPGEPGRDYTPVITPSGAALPWKVVDGVKVYHLIAEPVRHAFASRLVAECWGYNGRVHGPTIEAVEGDRVRVYVTNRLSAPTTVHWHGIILPNGMDGVGGLTQRAIHQGETFKYEWTFRQHGTFISMFKLAVSNILIQANISTST